MNKVEKETDHKFEASPWLDLHILHHPPSMCQDFPWLSHKASSVAGVAVGEGLPTGDFNVSWWVFGVFNAWIQMD